MSLFTVLGASGFIGANLVHYLRNAGHNVNAVQRVDPLPRRAGHVVYCIGLTADFRNRPHDTVHAHVSTLDDMLRSLQFESFTYLSSTRVYQHLPSDSTATEDIDLVVNPSDPSDLYNISKLMGETLCLTGKNPSVRAVRLSNVFGGKDCSTNFLSSILQDAVRSGHVVLRTPPDAAKDYIDISDVVQALEKIPTHAKSRLLNLASGQNVSNAEILDMLRQHTGCTVELASHLAGGAVFPKISIERMQEELAITPKSLQRSFAALVEECRVMLSEMNRCRTSKAADVHIRDQQPRGAKS